MPKLIGLEVSLGLTVEVKNVWLKPNIGFRFELSPEEGKAEVRKEIIERAFAVLDEEIDAELKRLGIDTGEEKK